MIGSAPKTAASRVAVPEVTTEKSEMDRNSLEQLIRFLLVNHKRKTLFLSNLWSSYLQLELDN
jgi:hypothetical protein